MMVAARLTACLLAIVCALAFLSAVRLGAQAAIDGLVLGAVVIGLFAFVALAGCAFWTAEVVEPVRARRRANRNGE